MRELLLLPYFLLVIGCNAPSNEDFEGLWYFWDDQKGYVEFFIFQGNFSFNFKDFQNPRPMEFNIKKDTLYTEALRGFIVKEEKELKFYSEEDNSYYLKKHPEEFCPWCKKLSPLIKDFFIRKELMKIRDKYKQKEKEELKKEIYNIAGFDDEQIDKINKKYFDIR